MSRIHSWATVMVACASLWLTACGCEAETVTVTREPFEVVKTLPANGETNVPVGGAVDIEFNHALRDEQLTISDEAVFFEPVDVPHVISRVAPKRIQVQLIQPLPYGTVVTVVVQGLQDSNNQLLHAYEFTYVTEIDVTPPEPPVLSFSEEITRDPYYDLTGNREEFTYIWVGYSSTLTDADIVLNRYPEDNTDPFSIPGIFTVRVPLDEGANRVGLLSEDVAGNRSEPVYVTIVRDSVAPAPPELDAAPASPTSSSSVELSGTLEDGADLYAYVNQDFISVPVSDGRWTMTLALIEGDNNLRLLAVDAAQNTSEPLDLTLRLDTTRPVITLGSVPARSDSSCVSISGTVNETATVYINGQQNATGTSFSTCHPLAPGDVTAIEIAAFDGMGNSTQLRRYVTQGSGPVLLKVLPETGSSVTSATGFAVHYFFDQPLAVTPAPANFDIGGTAESTALSQHRSVVSITPVSPVAGAQTITVNYTPPNSSGQSGSAVSGSTFTWTKDGESPALADITATALDNRGIRWSIDLDCSAGVWFVVAATQTSLTGAVLTTVIQGASLPLVLEAPMPWAPVSITATVYGSSGETAYLHDTLYPTSTSIDLGRPLGDEGQLGAVVFLSRPTNGGSAELYAGAATLDAVAYYSDASSPAYDYATGPNGFGSALTYSSTTLYASAAASDCIYETALPLTLSTFGAAQSLVCGATDLGTRLAYDSTTDWLWASAPGFQSGGTVGQVTAYDPTDASEQQEISGFDDFRILRAFRTSTETPQILLHGGQHSGQYYGLWADSRLVDRINPTEDLKQAFATGDFDGDGYDDLLVFTLADLLGNDNTVSFRMYAGGYAGDLVTDRSGTLSGWTDLCVWALSGVADLNGDGRDDLVCASFDDIWAEKVLIVWGSPAFFADTHLRISAINNPGASTHMRARVWAVSPVADISGDALPDLALQRIDPTPSRMVIYP